MEGNNNAPFYSGQEIVRIKKTQDGIGKIGDWHIAYKCEQCKKCKKWYVDIGERVRPHADIFRSVCNCGHKQEMPEPIVWYSCSQFAPIQHQYTDIAKEIADSFTESPECPDKIIVPEKVNN